MRVLAMNVPRDKHRVWVTASKWIVGVVLAVSSVCWTLWFAEALQKKDRLRVFPSAAVVSVPQVHASK